MTVVVMETEMTFSGREDCAIVLVEGLEGEEELVSCFWVLRVPIGMVRVLVRGQCVKCLGVRGSVCSIVGCCGR